MIPGSWIPRGSTESLGVKLIETTCDSSSRSDFRQQKTIAKVVKFWSQIGAMAVSKAVATRIVILSEALIPRAESKSLPRA